MKLLGVAAVSLLGSVGCRGGAEAGLPYSAPWLPQPRNMYAGERGDTQRMLNYIDAVKCLGKKPAKTPAAISSGARSRYDDFIVTHIIQTLNIHGTGNFLSWHRYFIWAYEQTLRNECGYRGYLPYNNWAWWSDDPSPSPLFDGSETSISGDGAYIAGRNHSCIPLPEPRCFLHLQPSHGGGCVQSGPFKGWKLNLGPGQTIAQGIPPNPQADFLGYNPRCLSRDLSMQAAHSTRDDRIVSLVRDNEHIGAFQAAMQGGDYNVGHMGVHNGGHFAVGGDAGGDFYNSPGDPAFYFHHGMIDRVWWVWQNLDVGNRQDAIAGTLTFLNEPPSRNATLGDPLSMGHVGVPNITVGDALNTLAGPFCYIYA